MFRKSVFATIKLGLLVFPLLASGQAVNSSPSYNISSNATLTPAPAQFATVPEELRQLVPAQSVSPVSQSTNLPAIAVAQAATAPAPTATLSAFGRSIPNGQSSTLMWSSTNATTCSGTGFSASGASGSLTVSPTATTTYGITCAGSGGSASQSVTVAVTPAPKLAVGMTVETAGSVAMHKSPSMSTPLVGVMAPGSKGGIIGGPASADGSTWWEVSYKDELARWAVQDDLTQASQAAPAVAHSVSPTSMPNSQSAQGGLTQASAQASAAAPTVTLSASPTSTSTSTSNSQSAVQGGPMKASAPASQAAPTIAHSASPTSMPNGQSAVQGGLTQASAQANQAAPTVTLSASPTSMPNSQSAVQGGLVQTSAQASQAAPTSTHSASPTSMPNGQSAVQGGVMQASAQASQAAPTVTFSASPTSIPIGQSSTLTWTSTNATACSGTGKGFSPSGPSGSLAVSPIATTTYGITCTGAGGSASQSVTVAVTAAPTLAIGMTVAATGTRLRLTQLHRRVRPRSAPRRPATRAWSSAVQRAPARHMVAGSLQRRPYRVDFSGRSRARIANGADTLVQRESCEHRPRRLVDAFMVVDQRDFLQRSRLLSIGRLRISLRLADCNHHVQHHLHRQWRIYNSNQRR